MYNIGLAFGYNNTITKFENTEINDDWFFAQQNEKKNIINDSSDWKEVGEGKKIKV